MTFTCNRTRYVSPFPQNPLRCCRRLCADHFIVPLKSRQLSISLASHAESPLFNATGVGLADVAKTSLGSSLALITSLVTALLIQSSLIAPDQSLRTASCAQRRAIRRLPHPGQRGPRLRHLCCCIRGPALHALQSGRVATHG
jgi:hypothetical protein